MKQNPKTKEMFLFRFVLQFLGFCLGNLLTGSPLRFTSFPQTGGLSACILSTYFPIDLDLDKEVVLSIAFRSRVSENRCAGVKIHPCSREIKVYLSQKSEIHTR